MSGRVQSPEAGLVLSFPPPIVVSAVASLDESSIHQLGTIAGSYYVGISAREYTWHSLEKHEMKRGSGFLGTVFPYIGPISDLRTMS